MKHTYPSGQTLELLQGDLLAQRLDAIINAANEQLAHGGGIAAAISRRGGPQIDEESRAWIRQHGLVTHETPAYTGAGNLPQRYVIHVVGPVWGSGDEDRKLAAAVRGALWQADELKLASLGLPAISTGIFGFPVGRAAAVFYKTIDAYFAENPASGLKLVRLVMYDEETLASFVRAWMLRYEL